MTAEEKRSCLIFEMYDYFQSQGFQIREAQGFEGIGSPQPLSNDGYGDQEDKRPDILAYDAKGNNWIIGIARISAKDIDSESSLTEYNVFLDQKDDRTGKPFIVYINLPSSLSMQFQNFLHHYIHYEYWHRIIVMVSKQFQN